MARCRAPGSACRVLPYVAFVFALRALLPGFVVAEGVTYAGNELCTACHASQAEAFAGTAMGKIFMKRPRTEQEKLGCESCHGPGSRHVAAMQSGEPVAGTIVSFRADAGESVAAQNAACLQCHERGDQAYWRGSPHESRGLACTSCHTVMTRRPEPGQLITEDSRTALGRRRATTEVCLTCHPDQRARMQLSSHMPVREGKLTCTSCHNPHGSVTTALLKDNSVNENCYRCHANKRGPFLWEHPPVRENCLTCHAAHGSNNPSLLTMKQPRLCQSCHMESTHAANAYDAGSRFAFNQSCANCHPQVHGSNHPSGVRLQR
jgi:DmsE family decaheme c-type cytochrome